MKFLLIIDKTAQEQVVVTAREKTEVISRIEELVANEGKTLLAYGDDEVSVLSLSEIECVTVIGGKTYAITASGKKFRLRMRLCEAESFLPSEFIRINKSAIANRNFIDRFTVSFSGAMDVVFKSGYKDYVSRRCFAEIKRRFGVK